MKLLRWFSLSLCVCVNAENNALWRESGQNVTLRCSSMGCPHSIDGYDWMYLYQNHTERRQVFYYNPNGGANYKITPGHRFKDRVQMKGSPMNQTITISELNVDDSGFYSCVFAKLRGVEVQCSVYTLFVRGVAQCPNSTEAPCPLPDEKGPPLVLIIAAACTIGMLVTIIFILLIVLRSTSRLRRMLRPQDVLAASVRRRTSSRRSTAGVPQLIYSDNVYEVMNGTASTLRESIRRLAGPRDCA